MLAMTVKKTLRSLRLCGKKPFIAIPVKAGLYLSTIANSKDTCATQGYYPKNVLFHISMRV